MNEGAQVSVANILHLSLRFAISPVNPAWSALPTSSITFQLGSQIQTVKPSATEVIFNDITVTSSSLSIAINGGVLVNGQPRPLPVMGLLPVKVDTSIIGVGAMTLPVLPVSIVYAPVVDAQKKNSATIAQGSSSGNTTTVTFITTNSQTNPIPTSFQSVSDFAKDMTALSGVLKLFKDPIVNGIGNALGIAGSALGSSSATQTNSTMVTSQHSLAVTASASLAQTAYSSQGGPGVGDLITYYYNARVVWYSKNGVMSLAVLGQDGINQTTAQQLKTALEGLQGKPAGTQDPNVHCDAAAIQSLLDLDPFVAGGSSAVLAGPRFVDISQGAIEIGAGSQTYTASHSLTKTDMTGIARSTTDVENDSAGFLSFLGLGVPQTQTLQSQLTQTTAAQTSTGQTFTQTYTFYGDGNEYYSSEVYFDVVFGSFAFRDVTPPSSQSKVSGTVSDASGKPLKNAAVKAIIGKRTFVTSTDSTGHFSLRLPGAQPGPLRVASDSAEMELEFTGMPLKELNVNK